MPRKECVTAWNPSAWQASVATVRGAAHRRRNQPNQDAVAQRAATVLHPWSIVAIADGHGSPSCPRSRTGARLAVRCAIAALHALAIRIRYSPTRADVVHSAEWRGQLTSAWRRGVAEHYERAPLAGDERGTPWLAYGTTLLAALALPRMLLVVQLGDGDILVTGPDGESALLWPDQEPALGEETASLCLRDASRWMRTAVVPVTERSPDLILLATDGYAKSFASRQDFLQVASDLRACRERLSWPAILRALPDWLRETTEAGSGDDISVGILSRF